MHLLRHTFLFSLLLSGFVHAAEKSAKTEPAATPPAAVDAPKSREEALQRAGVKMVAGPSTVALGKVAELKLPAGHHFVGPDSLDKFYELTQNMRSGKEVGLVITPDWTLVFAYDDIGYVKDEEKDKLDGNALMKAMSEGQEAANEERKRRNWDQIRLAGWATAPHYDGKTNHLKWAINLTSSQDNFKEVWINESIRLLGRGGVMNITLASDQPGFKAAEAQVDKLLAENFSYVSGQKYAEFKSGDKVAAIGLSALVLGGAGVMAAKMGLFAKLGVFFSKFWKAIVFGLIAIGAVLKKFLNRVTGAQPDRQQPPAA